MKKPHIVASKSFDLSCTIFVGTYDIDIAFLQNVESFTEKECVLALCSIEKRGAFTSRKKVLCNMSNATRNATC